MNRTLLTKDGEDWMVLALDPFHDFERSLEGMPDQIPDMSFVRHHVQTVSLTSPGAGGKLRVIWTGFHAPERLELTPLTSFWASPMVVPEIANFGPLAILSATGADEPSLSSVFANNAAIVESLPTTPTADIPSRLIGIGIEIHDTTAKLAQQGVIGVARIPGAYDSVDVPWGSIASEAEEDVLTPCTLTVHREPCVPATRQVLSLQPSFLEWEASRGVYAVPEFVGPAKPAIFKVGLADAPDTYHFHPIEYREAEEATPSRFVSFHSDSSTLPLACCARGGVQSGFEPLVIDLSGLAATSTFRLTFRTYVEYFPESNSGSALANATVSPPYDPTAFQLYHQAVLRLPSGVPVGLNAKGDWFRMVLRAIKRVGEIGLIVAPPILKMAGVPGAAAAVTASGALIKAGARAVNELRRRKQNKKPSSGAANPNTRRKRR